MDDVEARSTDGSDNGSDLEDFLVNSEDDDDVYMESDEDEATAAKKLLDEFPYDKSLLTQESSTGPRRSRRTRNSVQRYQDPDYMKLMMDDADPKDVFEDSDDGGGEESDGEYAVAAADDESDESDYDDQ